MSVTYLHFTIRVDLTFESKAFSFQRPIGKTYVADVQVAHQQLLVVTNSHLQQLPAPPQTSRVERQTIIVLRLLLLLDAHGVNIVSHRRSAPLVAALGAHAAVGGVPLLLQDQILRRRRLHDRVGRQPGEAGHRREVAEHYHAGSKIGVHTPVGAQEFTPYFVLNDVHVEGWWAGSLGERN